MVRFSRRELAVLFLASTLLMAWSSLPNWSANRAQDEKMAYGGAYFDPQDYAVHITMLRAGMGGAWAYNLRFTSEPHSAADIRMFYVLLGELNRLIQIPPELLYQIARWVLGYAALYCIYTVAAKCFDSQRSRWLAFALIALGSGLGWLQRILGWVPTQITPIDFWFIDGYILFSLSLFPHFALTLALMCLAWLWYMDYLDRRKPALIAGVIVAALAVQLVNPVAFVSIDVAISTATLVHWIKQRGPRGPSEWLPLVLIAVAQLPLFLYTWNLLTRTPVWEQFTVQDQTLSPPPIYYLWGYALLWPLVVIGALSAFRMRNTLLLSAFAWIVVAFSLAYFPFNIQRRFLLGITIPMGLLATQGLIVLSGLIARNSAWWSRRAGALALLIVLLASTTTILFMPAQAIYMRTQPAGLFYPRALDAAFDWLAAKTQPDDFVLAAVRTSQLAAQKTGRRVIAGHEMETIDFPAKVEQVQSFYRMETTPGWLRRYPAKWVIYGPYERELGTGFHPDNTLQLVFDVAGVSIYKNLLYSGG